MKKNIFPILFSALFLPAATGCSAEKTEAVPEISQETITTMADRANDIAFSFYRQKAAGNEKNFFFSPYSMRSAFAMAMEGAAGETAAEIGKVFSFSKDRNEMHNEFKAVSAAVAEAAKGTVFSDANSFWSEKKYPFLSEYVSALKKHYGSTANSVSFSQDAEGARKKINSWTEKNTNGIIKDLFAEGSIDPITRLVLVNAVYFKGSWDKAFSKNSTFEADFHPNNGMTSKAELMRHEESTYFPLGRKDGTLFLAMPYRSSGKDGAGLEMMVILPENKEDFARTEKNLSSEYVNEARKSMTSENVRVFMPKFKFSSSHELNKDLQEMGMPLAFSNSADFSGMTGNTELKIGTAVQKAFIDVSEEGTEAAAATGVAMTLKSVAPMPAFIFRADKPFIFLIRDVRTGLILFMGKVENPRA